MSDGYKLLKKALFNRKDLSKEEIEKRLENYKNELEINKKEIKEIIIKSKDAEVKTKNINTGNIITNIFVFLIISIISVMVYQAYEENNNYRNGLKNELLRIQVNEIPRAEKMLTVYKSKYSQNSCDGETQNKICNEIKYVINNNERQLINLKADENMIMRKLER